MNSSSPLNVLEAFYTKTVLQKSNLHPIECNGLSEEIIKSVDEIIGSSDIHPTVKLLHLCKAVGNLPYILGTSIDGMPKIHCVTKIADKRKDRTGMVLHGPEKIAVNLAQRVLPLGDTTLSAKPPVANLNCPYGIVGEPTLFYQMIYDCKGGIVGDGEMCSLPSCKCCGMPTFNAIYYMYCMTQVASHSTPMDMNYEACHITAKHFASNIDDHTNHLKQEMGLCDVKTPVWMDCKECTPNIHFGCAMDIVNNKKIRYWLDAIHDDYKMTTKRWFVPQRHFLCYSMNLGHKCYLSKEEIEERRNKLLSEKMICTERKSVIDSLGIRAKIYKINESKTRGILELDEACHLQERHDYTQKIIHTTIDRGTLVAFDVNAIPCALQGTNCSASRTFCGEVNDPVVCNIFTHPVDGFTASFVLPRDHYIINRWAKRASDSFSSMPIMLPMYCVPEDSEDDILDTINKASKCFDLGSEDESLQTMKMLMKHCAQNGAAPTNNLTFPILMESLDSKWLMPYIQSNVDADSLIAQGGPDDWAIYVADKLYYDTRIVNAATRDKLTELQIWHHLFEELYPFLKASDYYRGMEKLLSAVSRRLIQCATKKQLLPINSFDRKAFRALRDHLHRLGSRVPHSDIQRTISFFLERNRMHKKKRI